MSGAREKLKRNVADQLATINKAVKTMEDLQTTISRAMALVVDQAQEIDALRTELQTYYEKWTAPNRKKAEAGRAARDTQ